MTEPGVPAQPQIQTVDADDAHFADCEPEEPPTSTFVTAFEKDWSALAATQAREHDIQDSEGESVEGLVPVSSSVESDLRASWMWGDTLTGILSRQNPLRWSKKKSLEQVVQELKVQTSTDAERPVLLKVLRADKYDGPWQPFSRLANTSNAIACLHDVMGCGSESPEDGLVCTYEKDWGEVQRGRTYQLKVTVVSAFELSNPAWRLGDIMVGPKRQAVYLELQLGIDKKETKPADNPSDKDSVSFESKDELKLFAYSGEKDLHIWLRDRRGAVQSCIRGDPLIGEAVITLDQSLEDASLHQAAVRIYRDGAETGKVLLHYQLLEIDKAGSVTSVVP
eukprot:TRINITY_DN20976_c0_g1_i1.p1 TRINITY_DN20976_c0_g1~~TRINITY_DN20976_c0_g1_i1.p1  ORF type:complete len:337 (-),score=47.88 TRINITY_DN20976_c0_g1_i1:145-1155(-)